MKTIVVHGTPKPQPRVKAFCRGKHAGVYTPKSADKWKLAIKEKCLKSNLKAGAKEVWLDLEFQMPRPKLHFDSKGRVKERFLSGIHTKKPDLDNLIKAVMDAMTDAGVWSDDSQVTRINALKWYADGQDGCCRINLNL